MVEEQKVCKFRQNIALGIEATSFLCQFEYFICRLSVIEIKNKMYREQIKRYREKPDL